MKRFKTVFFVVALIFALSCGAVYAGSTDTNVGVSATILGTCSVNSATNVTFGPIEPGAQASGTGSISVTCSSAWPFTVALDNGDNYGNSRRMNNGEGSYLSYGLYQDQAHIVTWGSGEDELAAAGNGQAQSLTIYGLVPGGQNASHGNYSDTVVATVSW